MKEILRYKNCFVCGDQNDHGLQAKFLYDGNAAYTHITATDAFEGYKGIYHGGIIAALLDEVMIKAILATGVYAVTAEMTVRYKHPVRTGEHVVFRGRVTGQKGRMFTTEGEVTDQSGRVCAEATGKYIEAKPELNQELRKSLD
jgi:uncharacterized protein (TIGR00369 family)